MFTGPTDGVYRQLDDPPEPLPPSAPPYPTTPLPVTLRNVGVHSAPHCTYDVTVTRVLAAIVAVEKQ